METKETDSNTHRVTWEYNVSSPTPKPVIIERKVEEENTVGKAGFILSLLSIFIVIMPLLGIFVAPILWFLGLILSIVGLFKAPRGYAIAGLTICIGILVVVLGTFGTLASLAI